MPHDVSHLPPTPARLEPHGLDDARDAVTRWRALLDARLIGNTPPTPPAVLARRAAADALFRRRAAGHARAAAVRA